MTRIDWRCTCGLEYSSDVCDRVLPSLQRALDHHTAQPGHGPAPMGPPQPTFDEMLQALAEYMRDRLGAGKEAP